MMDLLYGLGAIASIVGILIYWRYANRAKKHETKAKKQIANQHCISELSQLQFLWNETYKFLADFGPSAKISGLRGRDTSCAGRSVQDYIEAVKRCSSCLQSIKDLTARLLELSILLNEFSSTRSGSGMKEKGTKLLTKLSDLNALIKKVLVSARDRVDLE